MECVWRGERESVTSLISASHYGTEKIDFFLKDFFTTPRPTKPKYSMPKAYTGMRTGMSDGPYQPTNYATSEVISGFVFSPFFGTPTIMPVCFFFFLGWGDGRVYVLFFERQLQTLN